MLQKVGSTRTETIKKEMITVGLRKAPKSAEWLAEVKQVMHCDIEATTNSLLASGDWQIIGVGKTNVKHAPTDNGDAPCGDTMFCLGRIR